MAQKRAEDFALRLDIDVFLGLNNPCDLTPILMPMDDYGKPVILKQTGERIDYYFARIDYFDRSNHVAASRLIYLIMPGHHNQAAYLPIRGRPKIFEVHRGFGYLMLGNTETEDDDGFPTTIYPLNPSVTPAITVPGDKFYVFEAADWQHEPFVISRLVKSNEATDKEILLQPHQDIITTSYGNIDVPEDFYNSNFK
jgi:hypothetical protein